MKRFILRCLAFFAVFGLFNIIVDQIYSKQVEQAITDGIHKNYLKWSDIHKNKQKYDLIVMGSSRAYTSYNPDILDSILGMKTYNMGTSAQDIAETYYMLLEILQYQKPKYVVIDLFFPSSDNSHEFYQILSNASFFNDNRIKFDLITKAYGSSGPINYAVPVIKLKSYIKQDISNFITKNGNPSKVETNWIKGFLYDTVTISRQQIKDLEPISNFENTSFDENRFANYMEKITDLLKQNNVKLITVRSPYPPSRLSISPDTSENVFFNSYTSNNDIPFYDFNTEKDSMNQNYLDTDFSDYHHPNYRGAKKASITLANFIKQYQWDQ